MTAAMISDERPDLMILDIRLTGMCGFEVCSVIRTNRTLRDIPVLMPSSLETEMDRIQAKQVGPEAKSAALLG